MLYVGYKEGHGGHRVNGLPYSKTKPFVQSGHKDAETGTLETTLDLVGVVHPRWNRVVLLSLVIESLECLECRVGGCCLDG